MWDWSNTQHNFILHKGSNLIYEDANQHNFILHKRSNLIYEDANEIHGQSNIPENISTHTTSEYLLSPISVQRFFQIPSGYFSIL